MPRSSLPPTRFFVAALAAAIACSAPADRAPPPEEPVVREPGPAEWLVSEHGIGVLKVGMTPDEVQLALRETFLAQPVVVDGGCSYALWPTAPLGVGVLVENDTIKRIDVKAGPVATVSGAQIGDSEARIDSLYRGRVAITPHKYTAGHYLTVTALAPEDSLYRTVFETDGRVVTSFRAGIRPAVEYVEGCG